MRCSLLLACAVAASAPAAAHAQHVTTARDAAGKAAGAPLALPAAGAFLGGTDDCSAGQTDLGSGTQLGVPFQLGTTGSAGQNEALCLSFGLTGIEHDVWFRWTATGGGSLRVTTCAGTLVDTKLALWPEVPGCPLDGTSLACNDDACGARSTVVAPVVAGSTYVIQLGTFPGAASGSGTFDVEQLPAPPCGQLDSGATTNAFGLLAGGELGWLQVFSDLTALGGVSTAYGSALFPGSVTNGSGAQIAVYDTVDPSATGAALAALVTVVVNGDTDLLNPHPLVAATPGGATLLASADQAAGEFPGPLDETVVGPEAWAVGDTSGPGALDVDDLGAADVPPFSLQALGFNGRWLLRADGAQCGPPPPPPPPTPLCFGDGSGTACPCANPGASGHGCANSVSSAGAALVFSGTSSLAADDLVLSTTDAPFQPGLFFQGDLSIAGGAGIAFGDGLRCCGSTVVRLSTVVPDAGGCAASDGSCGTPTGGMPGSIPNHPANVAAGGIAPGDTRCYQFWYRDPVGAPCGSGFNLSNAIEVVWAP